MFFTKLSGGLSLSLVLTALGNRWAAALVILLQAVRALLVQALLALAVLQV